MRRLAIVVLTLALPTLSVPAARAASVAVSARAGTLGLGVEVTGRLDDRLNLRGSFNHSSISGRLAAGGVDYGGALRLRSLGIFLDWHPWKGTFRASIGLVSNQNEVELHATPMISVKIGGTTYASREIGTLSGNVRFRPTAPYLGIGTGNAVGPTHRLHFLFDAGVIFQGSPTATLSATNPIVSPHDLGIEGNEISDDLKWFKIWPLFSFGLAYRF